MAGIVIAAVMALVSVLVHFEALMIVQRLREHIKSVRLSLLGVWFGLLFAHVVEIWLYAMAYWFAARTGIGSLSGMDSVLDYGYFSAVVYTTLGFGDILPDEGLTMLAGSEALVGLCLIAWSATITYSHTQEILERDALRSKADLKK